MTKQEKIELISDCMDIPKESIEQWDDETIEMECFRLTEDPNHI